ncbi:hypothetical protein EC968_004406 [Mortierella alpina]|nr:hypothetical protein EC968_004406 [Mortierella alpina]
MASPVINDAVPKLIQILEMHAKDLNDQSAKITRSVQHLCLATTTTTEHDCVPDSLRGEVMSDLSKLVEMLSVAKEDAAQRLASLKEQLTTPTVTVHKHHRSQDVESQQSLAFEREKDTMRLAEIAKEVRLAELAQLERIRTTELAQLERIRALELEHLEMMRPASLAPNAKLKTLD